MSRFNRRKSSVLACILLSQLVWFAAAPGLAADEPIKFEIAAGNAADTLSQFSRQSGLQVLSGPTAGYLVSFLVAAAVVGMAARIVVRGTAWDL